MRKTLFHDVGNGGIRNVPVISILFKVHVHESSSEEVQRPESKQSITYKISTPELEIGKTWGAAPYGNVAATGDPRPATPEK